MKELDELEESICRVGSGIPVDDRKRISDALGYARDAFSLLEGKYLDAIQDRAVVHSLLKHTSEDLIQHYRAIFEYSGTAMVVLERDGTISLANSNFTNLLGYSREETEGHRHFSAFVGPSLNDRIDRFLHSEREEDADLQMYGEGRVTDIHGQEHFAVLRLGKFPGTSQCVLSITDITDHRRAEEALRESEEKYRALFDNAGDPIFIHDMDGRILAFNPLACEQYGYPCAEFLSMMVGDVDSADDAAFASGRIARVSECGQESFESKHRRCDGSVFPVMVSARRITWEGQPAVMSICHDVTALKRAEKALRQTNRKLQLLSGITRHDIRNQLVALTSYLILSQSNLGDPVRTAEFIEKGMKIADVISSQISFTKDYENLGVHAPVWQDLSAVIETATSSLPVRDIRIDAVAPLPAIFADPLLEKVFYNLIDNALRYGGPKMTAIRISARHADGGLVIVVDDDGEGIPASDRPMLFEKGFGKNTGLGLFLSREILSITGITIEETGDPGKGARFELTVKAGMYRFRVKARGVSSQP